MATGSVNFLGASVSGIFAHWRRRNVDLIMGAVLLAGGLAGSFVGVKVFAWLRSQGQIDVMISILYVVVLGLVGGTMFYESVGTLLRSRGGRAEAVEAAPKAKSNWAEKLPFRMTFARSQLEASPILPVAIGFLVGILSALMGVGGGFIMVPAMIYLIGMPTRVVFGTSLFQIIFVTANTAFFQAVETHTVDVVLAFLLLLGGVVGAQMGTWVGGKLKAEQLRVLLALVVLGVCVRMAADLFLAPGELFSVARVGG